MKLHPLRSETLSKPISISKRQSTLISRPSFPLCAKKDPNSFNEFQKRHGKEIRDVASEFRNIELEDNLFSDDDDPELIRDMTANAFNVFSGLKAADPLVIDHRDASSGVSSFREEEKKRSERSKYGFSAGLHSHTEGMSDVEYLEQRWLSGKESERAHGKIDHLRRWCGNKFEMTRQISEMWEDMEEESYVFSADGRQDALPAWIKATDALAPDVEAFKSEMQAVNESLSEGFLDFVEEQFEADILRIQEDDSIHRSVLQEPNLGKNPLMDEQIDRFRRVDVGLTMNPIELDMLDDDADRTEVVSNWGEEVLGDAEQAARNPFTQGAGVLPLLTGWEPCQSLTLEDLLYEDDPHSPGERRLILPGIEDDYEYSEEERASEVISAMDELLSQTDDDEEEAIEGGSGGMDASMTYQSDDDLNEEEDDTTNNDLVNDMWK